MKNSVPIYNYQTAKDLLGDGFHIVELARNKNNPSLVVFHFERSDFLIKTLRQKYGIIWR